MTAHSRLVYVLREAFLAVSVFRTIPETGGGAAFSVTLTRYRINGKGKRVEWPAYDPKDLPRAAALLMAASSWIEQHDEPTIAHLEEMETDQGG